MAAGAGSPLPLPLIPTSTSPPFPFHFRARAEPTRLQAVASARLICHHFISFLPFFGVIFLFFGLRLSFFSFFHPPRDRFGFTFRSTPPFATGPFLGRIRFRIRSVALRPAPEPEPVSCLSCCSLARLCTPPYPAPHHTAPHPEPIPPMATHSSRPASVSSRGAVDALALRGTTRGTCRLLLFFVGPFFFYIHLTALPFDPLQSQCQRWRQR